MENDYKGKKILVTGGTGSIGSEIVRQLLKFDPAVVRVFSRDEFKQYELQRKLKDPKLRFLLGDVRDKDRLMRAMEGIDIVFHAAALKQVPSCEYNPFEAVKTNVIGTKNLIGVALERNVEKVISISTDKAVSPRSTMGATKLLSERLITDANAIAGDKKTMFCSVRFGNVMGSRGSVIPLFIEKIKNKEKISMTDPSMLRFMMTIPQAVTLVLESAVIMRGGELFVLKMPLLRLGDLTEEMINVFAPKFGVDPSEIKIETIGLRPGEKMSEELLTEHEALHALETDKKFIILPEIQYLLGRINYKYLDAKKLSSKTYTNEGATPLNKEEIKKILTDFYEYYCNELLQK